MTTDPEIQLPIKASDTRMAAWILCANACKIFHVRYTFYSVNNGQCRSIREAVKVRKGSLHGMILIHLKHHFDSKGIRHQMVNRPRDRMYFSVLLISRVNGLVEIKENAL